MAQVFVCTGCDLDRVPREVMRESTTAKMLHLQGTSNKGLGQIAHLAGMRRESGQPPVEGRPHRFHAILLALDPGTLAFGFGFKGVD